LGSVKLGIVGIAYTGSLWYNNLVKEYNRKTKQWEEKSTEKVGELKKKDTCRGGKPHDFRLTLPPYYRNFFDTDVPESIAEKWYESEERVRACEAKEAVYQQEVLGLKISGWRYIASSPRAKHYRCTVCGKLTSK